VFHNICLPVAASLPLLMVYAVDGGGTVVVLPRYLLRAVATYKWPAEALYYIVHLSTSYTMIYGCFLPLMMVYAVDSGGTMVVLPRYTPF